MCVCITAPFPYFPARIIKPDNSDVPPAVLKNHQEQCKREGRSNWQLVQFFDKKNDWGTVDPKDIQYIFRFPGAYMIIIAKYNASVSVLTCAIAEVDRELLNPDSQCKLVQASYEYVHFLGTIAVTSDLFTVDWRRAWTKLD